MQDREAMPSRLRDVWAQLDRVNDPELDEPMTDLGFVEAVSVGEDGDVLVCFRLPTYWCCPNFAFLMAEGIRREVGALPWVARVSVRLEDHMCAEEMNAAVNDGRSFAEALALRPEFADLSEVREKFDGQGVPAPAGGCAACAARRRLRARTGCGDDARPARSARLRRGRGRAAVAALPGDPDRARPRRRRRATTPSPISKAGR